MKKLFILFTFILFVISCGKDKDNIKDGYFSYPYENGQTKIEGNHKDGKKDGKWNIYYENGQIEYNIYYKNGEKDGKWIWYYENGQIKMKDPLSSWRVS